MTRKEALHSAEVCVCGQREEDYGSPEDNFRVIAQYWEVYLKTRCVGASGDTCIEAEDVANMMALLKIGRITTGQTKEDDYVDACGYMACSAEIATSRDTERTKTHAERTERTENAARDAARARKQSYCDGRECHKCPVGRAANNEHISCPQYVRLYPEEALEIMRKAVE